MRYAEEVLPFFFDLLSMVEVSVVCYYTVYAREPATTPGAFNGSDRFVSYFDIMAML